MTYGVRDWHTIRSYRVTGRLPKEALVRSTRNANVDVDHIRKVLNAMPEGVSPELRSLVEEYLSMPDDEARQRKRDELLKWLYFRSAFSNDDYRLRKAYTELRLAINPWLNS